MQGCDNGLQRIVKLRPCVSGGRHVRKKELDVQWLGLKTGQLGRASEQFVAVACADLAKGAVQCHINPVDVRASVLTSTALLGRFLPRLGPCDIVRTAA